MTASGAYEAMLEHHKVLTEQLAERAETVSAAVAAGEPHGAAVAGLIAYLAEEVLPHAAAEEKTVYLAAAEHAGLAATVGEMITEHVRLSAGGARLAALTDAREAAEQAQEISALFAAHAVKENEVLLPALLADESVNLGALLDQMHHDVGHAKESAPADSQAEDPQATTLALLLQAAAALARAGDADRACRIAASAWAALHETRPELAAKVTAALHGLTRKVEGGSLGGSPGTGKAGSGTSSPAADPDLDVRAMPPAQRHTTIFDAYRALLPGTGFVLVNDHDPKPLRYQFEAEHAGQFSWDSLEAGPEVWRVRIGRPPAAEGAKAVKAADAAEGAGQDAEEEPDLDVRQVSHGQRHGLIFTAYNALQPGRGFVLVNDHDPRPLRYQFEAQYAGDYTWDYQEAGPKVWRVRIGRPAAAEGAKAAEGAGAGQDAGEEPDLDVRQVLHGQRHHLIFNAYHGLKPGRGFVLVNDHDPLPLRYQFEAQYAGEYTWDYQEAGPKVWRVRIGRS